MVPERAQTLAERALAAWREERAGELRQGEANALAQLERRREWLTRMLGERFGLVVAPQDVEGDPDGPLTVAVEDLVFADGTDDAPCDGTIRLVRPCRTCTTHMTFCEVDSVVELGRVLAESTECSPCYRRRRTGAQAVAPPLFVTGPATAEREWREALAALNVALADADTAINKRAAVRAGLSILEASAIASADGRNEAQRAASVALALANSDQARAYRIDEGIAESALRDAQRRERIATEQCRLARALLAWHTARASSGDDAEVGA